MQEENNRERLNAIVKKLQVVMPDAKVKSEVQEPKQSIKQLLETIYKPKI